MTMLIVVVGAQWALQPPVNNRLADSVGRLGAAFVNNLIGTFLLAVVFMVVFLAGRIGGSRGPAGLVEVPLWQLLGGVIGGLWVLASVVAVGRVGAGTVAAAVISGQLISALITDQYGLLGIERQSITWLRFLGALLLMVGTILVARRAPAPVGGPRPGGPLVPVAQGDGGVASDRHLPMVLMVFVVGLGMGFQPPLNALLSETVGDFTSALVNFAIGTVLLLLAVMLVGNARRLGQARSVSPRYLLGGLFGVIAVLASLVAVKDIGATTLIAALVTGQLLGSVALDRAGILGLEPRPLSPQRVGGLLMLMVGTVLALG